MRILPALHPPTRPRGSWLVAAALLAGPARAATEDPFHAPVRIGDAAGADGVALTLDAASEPAVAFISEDGIAVARGTNAFHDPVLVVSGAIYHAPRITPGLLGALHLFFQRDDPAQPERGGEIYATGNLGGRWRTPSNLTRNDVDDAGPVAVSGPDGVPRVAWTRAGETILLDDGSGTRAIAEGVIADIAVDGAGAVHVVYTREGDIFYARQEGGGFVERNLTASAGVRESDPRLAVSPEGIPSVVYVRDGAVLLRHGDLDDAEPVSGDLAGASNPALARAPGGELFLAFAAEGRLHALTGPPGSLSTPRALPGGEGASALPAVAVGPGGLVHVAFERDGAIYYTNNAYLPQPAFAAEPSSGERPLEVRFRNLTRGDARAWRWDFGDGTTSLQESPVHVYEEEGAFAVTLRVTGPAGYETERAVEDAVLVLSPSNMMRIPDVDAFPGEMGLLIPVIGTHPEPVLGVQVALVYEPARLDVQEATLEDTAFAEFPPDFFVPRIDAERGRVTAGIVLDVGSTEGRSIRPGRGQHLLHLRARIPNTAPEGSESRIELRNQLGDPPINNIFTVGGQTVFPVLEGGTLRIRHVPFPFPRLFIRGDPDADGLVVLTDAIYVLNYIFVDGPPPVCIDAADVDDNGRIDIADPIKVLEYLFAFGPRPPYPHPGPGLDPTEDALPSC